MRNLNTPIESIINNMINEPGNIIQIAKTSGYNYYLLSCKLRVMFHKNESTELIAEDFGINKHQLISYYCNIVEDLKN